MTSYTRARACSISTTLFLLTPHTTTWVQHFFYEKPVYVDLELCIIEQSPFLTLRLSYHCRGNDESLDVY